MRIPIVNEQDQIIGYKDYKDRNPKEITRVSALWVTDKEGNILLAQRGFNKRTSPGLWGPAVAGTVEEGESYEVNVIKEAQEEIGLKNFIPKLERKVRRSTSHEYFGQWFSVVVDHKYPFVKQDSEVEQIKWFSKSEIIKLFNENPKFFVSRFNFTIDYFLNYENKN